MAARAVHATQPDALTSYCSHFAKWQSPGRELWSLGELTGAECAECEVGKETQASEKQKCSISERRTL